MDAGLAEPPQAEVPTCAASAPAPQPAASTFSAPAPAAATSTVQAQGWFSIDDWRYTLAEAVRDGLARQGGFGVGIHQLQLTSHTRVRGDIKKGRPFGAGFSFNAALIGFFSISAVLHIVFMLLAFYTPSRSRSFGLDGFDMNNRFVQAVLKPKEEQKGARAKDAEGDRQSDQKEKNSGALNILSDSQILFNWSTGSVDSNCDSIVAMRRDNEVHELSAAYERQGLGICGTGCGGVSDNSIGSGGFGTRGRGGEGGEGGAGYGRDVGDLEERATKIPTVVPGAPIVTGSLDKELIRRVIRKHRNEIKYCYEQELIKNKSLAGKVVVQFTISSTGSVVAAVSESSTLNNPGVERCIAGKVRRWIFPEPKGGGIVIVKYPFVFAPQ